jgi:hypothetical protein
MLGIHSHLFHVRQEAWGEIKPIVKMNFHINININLLNCILLGLWTKPISPCPCLTGFMRKDRLTDGAGPHTKRGWELGRFRMTGEVLPETAFIHVVLPTDWTGMIGCSSLGCKM